MTSLIKNILNDKSYKKMDSSSNFLYDLSDLPGLVPEVTIPECLICYDSRGLKPIIVCRLCSKFVHYKCYQKFIKKNNYYAMKCIQCDTRSLQFKKKWWQSWCCF